MFTYKELGILISDYTWINELS